MNRQVQISAWPARMKSETACAYLDMSHSSFMRAIEAGDFPRGKKGIGGVFWLKEELDNALKKPTSNNKPIISFDKAI